MRFTIATVLGTFVVDAYRIEDGGYNPSLDFDESDHGKPWYDEEWQEFAYAAWVRGDVWGYVLMRPDGSEVVLRDGDFYAPHVVQNPYQFDELGRASFRDESGMLGSIWSDILGEINRAAVTK